MKSSLCGLGVLVVKNCFSANYSRTLLHLLSLEIPVRSFIRGKSMKTKFFALAAVAVMLLNVVGFANGDAQRAAAKKAQATRLVSMLPASDAVVVFDSKQFLNDSLPKLLAANQPLLNSFNSHINEVQAKTGIDIRKFDQLAAGFSIKQITAEKTDCQFVAIAGGDVNVGSLIALAKLGSDGKYREETVGGKTVYVFSIKDAARSTAQKTTNSTVAAAAVSKGIHDLPSEIAVTALDQNTIAFGNVDRIRDTIDATSKVSPDITVLLSSRETTVASFALKTRPGMTKMIDLDTDAVAKDLDSIQYVTGSMDVAAAGTSMQLMARTQKAEQAVALKDLLDVMQSLGSSIMSGSKKPDQQKLGRLVKSVKVGLKGNDVTVDLLVPQADIDAMVAGIKIK